MAPTLRTLIGLLLVPLLFLCRLPVEAFAVRAGEPSPLATCMPASDDTFLSPFNANELRDSSLGLYYLRARYLNAASGRFWNADSYEGDDADPASLHKYLYCNADAVNGIDPSGYTTMTELNSVVGIIGQLTRLSSSALNVYFRAQTVLDIVNFLVVVEEVLRGGSLRAQVFDALKEMKRDPELTTLDPEDAAASLLRHTDDIVLLSAPAWTPYLVPRLKSIDRFVIYLPTIGNLPYVELGALPVKIRGLKLPIKLAAGGGSTNFKKKAGRLTGVGVGLQGKAQADQIWRMDYHQGHQYRDNRRDLYYLRDRSYHYHIRRPGSGG